MKHLKLYEDYNSSHPGLITDPELVTQWLEENLVGVLDSYRDIRIKEGTHIVNPNGVVNGS